MPILENFCKDGKDPIGKIIDGPSGNFHWVWPSQAGEPGNCLLYTSPSPRDRTRSRMPSSA